MKVRQGTLPLRDPDPARGIEPCLRRRELPRGAGPGEAVSKAQAMVLVDGGGRLTRLTYAWQNLTGTPSTTPIMSDVATYENTGLNRGLKLSSTITAGGQSATHSYGYDPATDMLTSASYADGMPNASQSWTYDAAGNRLDAGSAFDNLNRPTSLQGQAVTSDILGNRKTRGSNAYGWDGLNRLVSYNSTSYAYRADGMRVRKQNGGGSTLTRYDGQMPVQDAEYGGSGAWQKTTDYAVGARGVDAMSVTTSSGTSVSYPLYDAHGNMISTLSKNGSGYTYSALRVFDAWGRVRVGATTGDPKGRYCASLGHRQDDESGLVYMRARYYEPGTGRFISEDPARDGINWFSYCGGDPVNRVDLDGRLDSQPGKSSVITLLGDLITLALQHLGITPDAITRAALMATSEAAKALAFLEGALYFARLAQGLLPLTSAALAMGAATGNLLPGLALGGAVAGLGVLSSACGIAAFVTIKNASYSIAMMFLEE